MLDVNGIALGLLEECLSGLMDERASELCAERGTSRNGCRERELATCLGTLTLRIPKLRKGSYFPGDIIRRWPTSPSAREHRVRVRTNNVSDNPKRPWGDEPFVPGLWFVPARRGDPTID